VLFIDDSLSVRTVAERFLTALGADVTLAIDGEDGLTQLRQAPFDLVFTDLEMPRVHGYDLIREIRRTPALSKLPIVVVTSRSGQKHRDQATAVGANDYLTKPFTPEVLGRMIRKWVRQDS
jgi:chemosensory pili system protein ChpA (sensor histidine kinase/response regulator)